MKGELRQRVKTKGGKTDSKKSSVRGGRKNVWSFLPDFLYSEEWRERAWRADPHPQDDFLEGWVPPIRIVFTLFLLIALLSALGNIIDDCDEVYNYWEPAHFLMYRFGFQTWEYSPEYSLRSYLYLLLHTGPASFLDGVIKVFYRTSHKVHLWVSMRGMIGAFSAISQTVFWYGVSQRFGSSIARYTFVFLLGSAGMFISTTG